MRILVINWQDLRNPLAGGAEVHLHEVFSRIARRGHDVTLLCSMFDGAAGVETVDGVKVVRHGSRSLFNYIVPRMYRRIGGGTFDVVVEDLNKIPFFTPLFVREPLVGIGHHLFRTSIYRETNPIVASYVFGMEWLALRLYARRGMPFLVNSPSTLEDFAHHGVPRDALTLAYLAVNHDLFRLTGVAKSPTPLIGCFGRLKRYKSIEVLLRALPAVLEQVPALRVVIAGEGDDRPRLEQVTRNMGLNDVVRFTGFITAEAKVDLLQRIWWKVATSVKEGWGLTVTEANACGTPVIASDVPGLRDAVRDGDTGVLFPYGDSGALAATLVRLLRDSGERERMSRNALDYAATFTWDNAAATTLEVLERVCRREGQGAGNSR
jgi:glycosyltransferase involved in cell wall biosynthesis